MNAERWKQIDELFDAVLEIPNEQREAFLAEKCSSDDDLKKEVLSLLAAQKETDVFLEKSAMNLMAKEIAHDNTTVVDFSILGRELGNYRIEKPLGAGGMGEVFLAHDSKLNRKVALKILPAEFVLDTERVKRFEREAKAVSALNHPNIVTIYDFGQTDGINFIVTEHIEGKTVRELIKESLSLKNTLNIVSQTCEALAAAHASGIIHRDIKPENIMVRPDGYVKVLDFGLAKLNPQADSIHISLTNYTQKGMIIGTLAYMSPEQISDDTVDQRADLWSLGVVLYEMATGKKPFQAESKQATFNAILSGEPLAATDSNASLPVELDRILEKALEKDKDLRYQTASDFRADLKRVRREIDSSPSSSSWSKSARRMNSQTNQPPKKSRLIYIVPVIALMILTVAGYFYWQSYSAPPAPNWTQARNVHLTDESGTEFMPSLAPDGEGFVYVAKNGEKYDIYRRRVGGKNATNLTPDTPNDDETHPAYSPDGKLIAFRSTRYPAGIYLMESTGENPRRLCKDGYHPAWSPDGKEIVSSEEDQNLPGTRYKSRLIITNVATGEQRVLHDGYAAQPKWSPHGQRVAFWIMQPGGKRDVATVSAAGGEPVLVTDSSGVNWNPVWSPDGNFLYFASDRKGNMGFWRVRIDEASGKVLGKPESVPTPAKFVRHLSFSRDGKRLIYVQTDDESNLKAVKFDQATERTIGEQFSITRREQEVVRPEISPDGKQFIMRLTRLTQHDIASVGSEGGGWRDLTMDEFSENYPRWSPDGKQIAYVSDRSGNYEIWTMDADGTNHKQWTFGNQTSASYPFWSPDGQKLGYDFNHNAYILDLTKPPGEQKPEELPGAENYSVVIAWDWSPDGKKLSGIFSEKGRQFSKEDNALRVGYYSFDTGRWEDLNISTYNTRWLNDSSRLIYYNENKAYIVDIHTKKPREIFSPPNEEQLKSVGISRAEDLIYYTNFSSESDIWMLDLSENQ